MATVSSISGLGQREVLAVEMVEALRHVARHLDVLHLVAAHRHLVRLEHQDVGAHQHRVHEQAGADVGVRVVAARPSFLSTGAL